MGLFRQKTWTDRIVEFAGRRKLTNVETGVQTLVDVERDEGKISQAGDAFSASNMNDLEQRVDDALGTILTQTLISGTKTVAFTSGSIKSNSIFDIYTDVFGVDPTNQSINGNTLTLTFDAQNIDVNVMLIVREGV